MKWPASNDSLEWAWCAAEWGLCPGAGEARDYTHFGLERLVEADDARRARTLIARLLATPPRDLIRRVMDVEAVAGALLELGDGAAAEEVIEPLTTLIGRQRRKSDADYLRGAIVNLREELGLREATDPLRRVKAAHRMASVAWRAGQRARARAHARAAAEVARSVGWGQTIVALLLSVKLKADALALWKRLPATERNDTDLDTMLALGLKAAASRRVKQQATRALERLRPSEWNVHSVLFDLERAYRDLRTLKLTTVANKLLSTTVSRLSTGEFDHRQFASSGAWVTLAKMVFERDGWEAARPMLERSMVIAGTPRAMSLPSVVSAAIELGRPNDAVELAYSLPASSRADSLIPALLAAKRWPEATASLKRIKDPKVAARVAWSQVRR